MDGWVPLDGCGNGSACFSSTYTRPSPRQRGNPPRLSLADTTPWTHANPAKFTLPRRLCTPRPTSSTLHSIAGHIYLTSQRYHPAFEGGGVGAGCTALWPLGDSCCHYFRGRDINIPRGVPSHSTQTKLVRLDNKGMVFSPPQFVLPVPRSTTSRRRGSVRAYRRGSTGGGRIRE